MAFRMSGISAASITIVWPSVSRAHPIAANSSLENHLRMWHCRKLASHFSLSACAVPVARNSAATPASKILFILIVFRALTRQRQRRVGRLCGRQPDKHHTKSDDARGKLEHRSEPALYPLTGVWREGRPSPCLNLIRFGEQQHGV